MRRTGLRDEAVFALVLKSLGVVAALAGARGVVLGAREVAGAESLPAAVDSEYRFYAAWYLVAGMSLLSGSGSTIARGELRFLSAGLWTAAAGRVLSLRQVGRPGRGQLVLLGVEVALPLVLAGWQARVARASG
jgi:hypothetical protein